MTPLYLIIFLIVGAVAGVVATRGVNGPRLGVVGNMALGVAGAFVGGFLVSLFTAGFAGWLTTFLAAAVGATILLAVFNKLTRDRIRR